MEKERKTEEKRDEVKYTLEGKRNERRDKRRYIRKKEVRGGGEKRYIGWKVDEEEEKGLHKREIGMQRRKKGVGRRERRRRKQGKEVRRRKRGKGRR